MPKKTYVGQLLAANPLNPKDSLDHSVILVVTHTPNLAFGLQINRPMTDLTVAEVSDQVGIYVPDPTPVYYGGGVGASKIHVIHSSDWGGFNTIEVTDELSVTSDISVLAAISRGEGPEYYKACAGIWGWEGDQLNKEIEARSNSDVKHRWEAVKATPELIFDSGNNLDHWHKVIEAAAREQVSAWF